MNLKKKKIMCVSRWTLFYVCRNPWHCDQRWSKVFRNDVVRTDKYQVWHNLMSGVFLFSFITPIVDKTFYFFYFIIQSHYVIIVIYFFFHRKLKRAMYDIPTGLFIVLIKIVKSWFITIWIQMYLTITNCEMYYNIGNM